jgi:hypothetical protein
LDHAPQVTTFQCNVNQHSPVAQDFRRSTDTQVQIGRSFQVLRGLHEMSPVKGDDSQVIQRPRRLDRDIQFLFDCKGFPIIRFGTGVVAVPFVCYTQIRENQRDQLIGLQRTREIERLLIVMACLRAIRRHPEHVAKIVKGASGFVAIPDRLPQLPGSSQDANSLFELTSHLVQIAEIFQGFCQQFMVTVPPPQDEYFPVRAKGFVNLADAFLVVPPRH